MSAIVILRDAVLPVEAVSCNSERSTFEGIASSQERAPRKIIYNLMATKEFAVYIMTNKHNRVLYTGMTNNLPRRVHEHKTGIGSKFVKKYNVTKLVYFEVGSGAKEALFREHQIKAGSRQKKIDLINGFNPEWRDLYEEI